MTVLGAEQQGAVGIEGFGAAGDFAAANLHGDIFSNGGATGFPFIGHGGEFAGGYPGIIAIQFDEGGGGHVGAGNFMAAFNFQGGGHGPEFGGEFGEVEIDVEADAENDVLNAIEFGAEFGEDADDFFAADQ